jgi:hypothetical protein
MTLKEFQAKINKLVKQGHGDKEVFYSSDEEGNSFDEVFYEPSVQHIDGYDGEVVVIN